MIAALAALRAQSASNGETAVIVSSAAGLRIAAAMCPGDLGEPEPVNYAGAIAWLLSLVPGARMGEDMLRGLLFDVGIHRRLPPLERHIARVLQASEEYKFHWSRRNTLYRAARTQLGKLAAQRGQQVEETEDLVTSGTDEGRELLIRVIAEAVDERSVSRSELENRQLTSRIQELEAELERERRKRSP